MKIRKPKEENSTKKNLLGRTVVRQTSESQNYKGQKGVATSKTVFKKDGVMARYKGEFRPYEADSKGKRTVAVTKAKITDNPKKKTVANLKTKSSSYKEKATSTKRVKEAPLKKINNTSYESAPVMQKSLNKVNMNDVDRKIRRGVGRP